MGMTRSAENRRWRYGLSEVDWKGLLLPFDGMCWICRKAEATDVDHDHGCCDAQVGEKATCGSCFRGALCRHCNVSLGHYERGRRTTWADRYQENILDYLGAHDGR